MYGDSVECLHNSLCEQAAFEHICLLNSTHICLFLEYFVYSQQQVWNVIAERRERSERSEANNRVLFEIPRYLYIYIYIYIYIYMSVCKCIVQDRAHLTQVLSRRPLCIWNTGCCSAHYLEESPIR